MTTKFEELHTYEWMLALARWVDHKTQNKEDSYFWATQFLKLSHPVVKGLTDAERMETHVSMNSDNLRELIQALIREQGIDNETSALGQTKVINYDAVTVMRIFNAIRELASQFDVDLLDGPINEDKWLVCDNAVKTMLAVGWQK